VIGKRALGGLTVSSSEFRFAFGKNWLIFRSDIDSARIIDAEESLRELLGMSRLDGLRFLDVGCGSGLFSLAARNLGAEVVSFDYDHDSVACTETVRAQFAPDCDRWRVLQGSILDKDFVSSLGMFDIVYSWGVLHHTGDVNLAMENVIIPTQSSTKLALAIYNHQGFLSAYWTRVKKLYVRYLALRPVIVLAHLIYPSGPSLVLKLLRGQKLPRGMSWWTDLIDWLGGFPFEPLRPEDVFNFFSLRSFRLEKIKTVGGKLGCNEYCFVKSIDDETSTRAEEE